MGIYDRDYMREKPRTDSQRLSPRRRRFDDQRLMAWARWAAIIGSSLGAMVYADHRMVEKRSVGAVEAAQPQQVIDSAPVGIDFFRQVPSHPGK